MPRKSSKNLSEFPQYTRSELDAKTKQISDHIRKSTRFQQLDFKENGLDKGFHLPDALLKNIKHTFADKEEKDSFKNFFKKIIVFKKDNTSITKLYEQVRQKLSNITDGMHLDKSYFKHYRMHYSAKLDGLLLVHASFKEIFKLPEINTTDILPAETLNDEQTEKLIKALIQMFDQVPKTIPSNKPTAQANASNKRSANENPAQYYEEFEPEIVNNMQQLAKKPDKIKLKKLKPNKNTESENADKIVSVEENTPINPIASSVASNSSVMEFTNAIGIDSDLLKSLQAQLEILKNQLSEKEKACADNSEIIQQLKQENSQKELEIQQLKELYQTQKKEIDWLKELDARNQNTLTLLNNTIQLQNNAITQNLQSYNSYPTLLSPPNYYAPSGPAFPIASVPYNFIQMQQPMPVQMPLEVLMPLPANQPIQTVPLTANAINMPVSSLPQQPIQAKEHSQQLTPTTLLAKQLTKTLGGTPVPKVSNQGSTAENPAKLSPKN